MVKLIFQIPKKTNTFHFNLSEDIFDFSIDLFFDYWPFKEMMFNFHKIVHFPVFFPVIDF